VIRLAPLGPLGYGRQEQTGIERMGMATPRQRHPISYPALPEGASTRLIVREDNVLDEEHVVVQIDVAQPRVPLRSKVRP